MIAGKRQRIGRGYRHLALLPTPVARQPPPSAVARAWRTSTQPSGE